MSQRHIDAERVLSAVGGSGNFTFQYDESCSLPSSYSEGVRISLVCGTQLTTWENKSTGSLLHYAARPISWNELHHDNNDTFAAASNQEQIVRVEECKTRNNMTSIGIAWRVA
jgi:hypothetical protein